VDSNIGNVIAAIIVVAVIAASVIARFNLTIVIAVAVAVAIIIVMSHCVIHEIPVACGGLQMHSNPYRCLPPVDSP
jgi:hypothetical protein